MDELKSIVNLTLAFSKFPSIGNKTAERMAYALLDMKKEDIDNLVKSIETVETTIHTCPICGSLTEKETCSICSNPNRDHSICVVVSYPKDVITFEKMGEFKGIYHVLGGEISSYHGVTPKDLSIDKLVERIKKDSIKEIVIATNPSVEGQTTALYLTETLKDLNIKISRIGFGIPIGGQLDYADSLTLKRSFENRKEIKEDKE
ncbi:MAG: recombination protein RecR [Firmicutes bacterium]|uniref:Recombination protein RecR n=1 Tax=Candidatus Onthovivens merdipullorum TaxID=2840889 RepID=A0A9D9DI52_9BACL|nr:recombination protein RecR [Candidatus Onthovivens merdipullorum]